MQPTWLIEANVEGLPSEALQAAIRRQGLIVHVVKPFLHARFPRDILGAEQVPLDACVVFTGTLPLMRYLREHRRWVPGGWCHFKNLACSTYYAYFGPYLLNRNYTMLPIAEAVREHRRVTSFFAQDRRIFIRPDSVDKLFAGQLVDVNSLPSFLTPKTSDPTTLVVAAEPQQVGYEWRLFIAHSNVITGSQYRRNGETCIAPGLPNEVVEFADNVLSKVDWRPDPLFVMDVCETDDGFRIVELNSYSCSGQCACDLDAYVSAATQFAAAHW